LALLGPERVHHLCKERVQSSFIVVFESRYISFFVEFRVVIFAKMGICDEAANVSSVHLNSCRKRKGRGDGSLSVAETLAKWKEHNA
jgi:hypothetical protein